MQTSRDHLQAHADIESTLSFMSRSRSGCHPGRLRPTLTSTGMVPGIMTLVGSTEINLTPEFMKLILQYHSNFESGSVLGKKEHSAAHKQNYLNFSKLYSMCRDPNLGRYSATYEFAVSH